MNNPLRLVFFGSDAIALPLLERLAGEASALAQVVAVFTQPDRPAGRGQKIEPNAIKRWALARNLPVFQPEKPDEAARTQLAALHADLGLVMAYGHLLRDDFLATPRLGMLNLHTSLLPKYRGASPIQTAVVCGERETGVTLMRIIRKLDAGPIADVERVPILARDTAADIEAKLAAACGSLLARALPKFSGELPAFTPQDEAQATYCRRLTKDDGTLDFAAPAAVLAARINGLFPWPGCAVEISGQPIKLGLADFEPATVPATSGTVLDADAESLRLATGGGILRLLRLQRPGGKMLPAPEFLRGFPIAPGTVLASRPMPELVGATPTRTSNVERRTPN
ncbi:MAG TPA: methionyl-tRNA formyltransferase [Opitutaceae bacterium]|jgi:methionyl-tRNA formyltransferase|nr:methionyl-tRNA formyltransferase [Opitutaceae bacterium]